MTDVADAGGDPECEAAAVDPTEESGRTADGEGTADPDDDGDHPDELVARVAATDVEAAAAVADLRRRVADLQAELDAREEAIAEREETVEELGSKLKRARADFQNYKKRTKEREQELRERATEDLVSRLLDVRDNLVRAVEQDDDVEVRDGVEATLATFDRVLEAESVSAIEPAPGDAVEPERHEVVHRTGSDRPEGTIVEVYRPGYEMAGRVMRPAQVTVSEGADAEEEAAAGGEDDGPE